MSNWSIPHPDSIPDREREDAMGAYLMMFAAVAVALPLPIINLIAAIVYHYINRSKSPFIHFHCIQSLWSQIPITLLNWVLLVWSVRIWWFEDTVLDNSYWYYLIFVVCANLTYFIFSIVAAIKARKGLVYKFVIIGDLCVNWVFSRQNSMSYKRGY